MKIEIRFQDFLACAGETYERKKKLNFTTIIQTCTYDKHK